MIHRSTAHNAIALGEQEFNEVPTTFDHATLDRLARRGRLACVYTTNDIWATEGQYVSAGRVAHSDCLTQPHHGAGTRNYERLCHRCPWYSSTEPARTPSVCSRRSAIAWPKLSSLSFGRWQAPPTTAAVMRVATRGVPDVAGPPRRKHVVAWRGLHNYEASCSRGGE